MNRFYNVYLVRDWKDVRSGPYFPIPLCKVHGKELKQLLKKKWHEHAAGLYIYNGPKTDEDCFFCEHPEDREDILKDLLASHLGLPRF